MKVLYLSCHAILEYDELKLLEEIGVDYFSLGSYIIPTKPVDPIRPQLFHKPHPKLHEHAPMRDNMGKEFIDNFDVVIVMHVKEWIINNWANLRHKPVIWRTIGRSTSAYERSLFPYRQDGLQVMRYSKYEANIIENIGSDGIVPFYKDPEDFGQWNGMNAEAIVFHQDLKNRDKFCGYEYIMQVFDGLPAHVYGPNNQNLDSLNGGYLTYNDMRQKLRDSRVYFYTGTQPASYTLNLIEAMMTGIPIVALGPKLWNSLDLAGDVYEVPELIQNGVNGFISDDIAELRKYIGLMLSDHDLARRIGAAGRETAIRHFGKDTVKEKWRQFLGKYGDV